MDLNETWETIQMYTKTKIKVKEKGYYCCSTFHIHIRVFNHENRIGGIIVSMLTLSTVDRGFESRSAQTKDYKIGICSFSAKHAALRRMSKDGFSRNQITCPCGATCLPTHCCFSELALWKYNSVCWSSTKWTSSSSHWKLTCSRHNIAEKLLNWR